MREANKFINNILLTIILIGIIVLGVVVYRNINSKSQSSNAALANSGNSAAASATQMADAGEAIPEVETVFIQNKDLSGLIKYLNGQAKNWVNMSFNIHSGNVYGVGRTMETVKSEACNLSESALNLLCRIASIEYTSVYKGVVTAGTDSDFILKPVITLKNDWSEISRVQKDNKIVVTEGATALVTYTGRICVTSVEENTPSETHQAPETGTPDPYRVDQAPQGDTSYTIKTADERRYWPDFGPSIWPTGINDDFLRIDSYKQAKTMALKPETIKTLYSFVASDMLPGKDGKPGGKFYEAIKALYTPELAKMFGVKGFEIVFNATPADFITRCDGSPINK